MGLIKKGLSPLLHSCCFLWRNLLSLYFKTVYEILNFSEAKSKADLALSFPFTPMWLRIQHIRISLELVVEFNLLKNFRIFFISL